MTDNADTFSSPVPGAFAAAALDLYDRGLCPMPCGGEGRQEAPHWWAGWTKRPPRLRFSKFLERPIFAEANIGILTGLSGITVVDCDDEDLVGQALKLFGETSLITATPSGGHHLWYRAQGEGCRNLRSKHGLAIDVKGRGGLSVEPPSIRPSGRFAGVAYRFVRGGLDDVGDLPSIAEEAREEFKLLPDAPMAATTHAVGDHDQSGIPTGRRNDTLFREALRLASRGLSEERIAYGLLGANALDCDPPLGEPEVRRIATSAWRMEREGRNWIGRGGLPLAFDTIDAAADANSFFLLVKLHRFHGARSAPFAMVPEAMAKSGRFGDMSAAAIRRARNVLIATGQLRQVHRGGRGPRDPSLFVLAGDIRASVPN
jgi:hypothetical protein